MKKKKNLDKQFDLKDEYKKTLDYLKSSKGFIYGIVIIFFVFALIGYFIPVPESVTEQLLNFIMEILAKTEGMSQFELIGFIFLNNVQSSFYGLVFGVLVGIFPLIATILNGYFLGFVAFMSVQADGISILWRLLPHGIFEFPAVFISLGLGLKLGLWLIVEPIKFYWGKNKLISVSFILFYIPTLLLTLVYNKQFNKYMKNLFYNFKNNIRNSLRIFLLIVIPLLIIAAIIEGSLMFLID